MVFGATSDVMSFGDASCAVVGTACRVMVLGATFHTMAVVGAASHVVAFGASSHIMTAVTAFHAMIVVASSHAMIVVASSHAMNVVAAFRAMIVAAAPHAVAVDIFCVSLHFVLYREISFFSKKYLSKPIPNGILCDCAVISVLYRSLVIRILFSLISMP